MTVPSIVARPEGGGSVAGVEDATMYGDKGIVEPELEGAVSVAVDEVKVGDGQVVLRGLERDGELGKTWLWGWNVPYLRWSFWTNS